MGNMRFKVGDKVRIKSLDWHNMYCDDSGNVDCGCEIFEKDMKPYLGKVFTIHRIVDNSKYEMEEAFDFFLFTDEMIEGLVEEETASEKILEARDKHYWDMLGGESKNEITLPQGYQFVDENGNVINTTKIVLVKKKKEYLKTYEECCKVLGYDDRETYCVCHTGADERLFENLYRLKVCRDAYWKLYGEEMGLNRPWEPDWSDDNAKYSIYTIKGVLTKAISCYDGAIFSFPTEEMRDAFKENFDPDMEICKELL